MVAINAILYNQDEEKAYRVLWISEGQKMAYLFALTCEKMPIAVSVQEIEQHLLDGILTEQDTDPYFRIIPEGEIPDGYKKIRDSIWRDVEALVSRNPPYMTEASAER